MAFQLDDSDPGQAHTAERLRKETILWLASVRADGRPHLAPVWFLWEGEAILIFSKPEQQKIRNIRQNPAVTLALDTADDGEDVLVLEGVATLVDDPDLTTALPAYASKYPHGWRRWDGRASRWRRNIPRQFASPSRAR